MKAGRRALFINSEKRKKMKFQINIEVDETETNLSQKEIVNYAIDSLAESLEKTGAYFDVGVATDSIINGLTN